MGDICFPHSPKFNSFERPPQGGSEIYRAFALEKKEQTMPKRKKELRQLYGGPKPKSYRPAHNHIIHTPAFSHGLNGFRRFWIPPQWVDKGWSECPCGWRSDHPEWKIHYASSDHVRWWKGEIKKRGSLDAVYRHIMRRLTK